MFRYIIKRLIQMIPLLFIISFLGFGIIRVAEVYANADPLAQMKMSPSVTKETIRREKLRLGYEKFYKDTPTLASSTYRPEKVSDLSKIINDAVTVKVTDKDALNLAQPSELTYFRGEDALSFSPSDLDKEISIETGAGVQTVLLKTTDVPMPKETVIKKVTGRVVPEPGAAAAPAKTPEPFTEMKLDPTTFAMVNGQLYFSPETVGKKLEIEYSTPNPFYVRYFTWISKFMMGDMGESYTFKSPVSSLILSRLGNTVILGVATLVVTWLIAIPLGIYLSVRQYSLVDQIASAVSYFFMGFPDFFLAILLLLVAAKTGWFPIGEMSSVKASQASFPIYFLDVLHHMVLPTITLSLISIASLQRRMRANMLDVLGEEYIKTARAKGLSEHNVLYKHAVRNGINPIITLLGFEIAGLISGAAFVEIIFSWPGLGNMMLQALLGTDLNLVMAGLMISTIMLLLGNLLADLLLAFADPRIKLEA
jgi:peptide/nickel transport system permease protein